MTSYLVSDPERVNTLLTKSSPLSCLPRIKYFDLPMSVTWPVCTNVNAEESSLGVGLKRIYISSVSSERHAHEPKT